MGTEELIYWESQNACRKSIQFLIAVKQQMHDSESLRLQEASCRASLGFFLSFQQSVAQGFASKRCALVLNSSLDFLLLCCELAQ